MNVTGILAIAAAVAVGIAAVPAQAANKTVSQAGQVAYTIVGDGIPKPLTDKPGDAENGKKVVINRQKGNCVACHKMASLSKEEFHGETGPELKAVGATQSEAQLRLRMVDAKALNPDTMMPSFYKSEGLNQLMEKFKGQTIMTAQEIEDVVAYLKTLK